MSIKPNAIVIGSGVAGLAISTRLALQGYNVSVYERNNYPGGKLGMFQKDGFQFDTGPSLFTVPENIETLFEEAGEDINEFLQYDGVNTTCKYFFENGIVINAYTDAALFADELENKLGEPPNSLRNYLDASQKLYKYIGNIFLNFSLQKPRTWLHKRLFAALGHLKLAYLFRTLHGYNIRRFKSNEARQIFNRFATYNGSNPYKAPAMLSVISHLELNKGVFYPRGGMISITNALYQLAEKKGVKFFMNSPVERIIYADGKAHGVVVNDKNISADVVVSNADIYFTWKNLIGRNDLARKVTKPERSSSAIVFYWGINKKFEELDLHNIFFSKNYQQEFDHIFKQKKPFTDPTIYVNITSKYDPSHAPAGKENWFVMINVPANHGQDWQDIKDQIRRIVIDKLSLILKTALEPLIESESILDPIIIEENTGSYMGALYGSSSNNKMAAFKRPANYTSYIKNLFFCGGTVHPGGGIPLCLKSAQITASLVAESKRKYKSKH
jgi:phytoene desaturase